MNLVDLEKLLPGAIMPEIYEITFPLRYYECDVIGHLNNASYLKYMQEAAFEASKAVGYDRRRFQNMGKAWVIRETKIDYLKPVYYGQQVRVKTWVADIRRVRSLRQYELYTGSEQVARAYSDWVFVDLKNNQPTGIPQQVVEAYLPGAKVGPSQSRTRFPAEPPVAPEIFTQTRRVEWRDVDPWGHVNNAVYLSYLEDCGMQLAVAYDWPWEKMEARQFAIIARQHHIQYTQPAHLDDILVIRTWIASIRRSTGLRFYTIQRESDQQLIAQCHSLYVWVDLSTNRPIRIPDEFLECFRNNIASDIFESGK